MKDSKMFIILDNSNKKKIIKNKNKKGETLLHELKNNWVNRKILADSFRNKLYTKYESSYQNKSQK